MQRTVPEEADCYDRADPGDFKQHTKRNDRPLFRHIVSPKPTKTNLIRRVIEDVALRFNGHHQYRYPNYGEQESEALLAKRQSLEIVDRVFHPPKGAPDQNAEYRPRQWTGRAAKMLFAIQIKRDESPRGKEPSQIYQEFATA